MVEKGDDALKHVEKLLREGKKQEALALLVGYVKQHPNSIQGWWQLSFIVPDVRQQIDCVERVLRLDSGSVLAQSRLEILRNDLLPVPIPPFVETESFLEPQPVPVPQPEQEKKTPVTQKTSAGKKPAPAKKKNNSALQYVVIGVMACLVVAALGVGAVMIFRNMNPSQPAQPASFTQISLPPTWTPQPTPTRNATITPYPTMTPVVIPTLAVTPTSTVPRSRIGPYNGYYAPDFSLKNINDNVTTSLSNYEGQAVIVFFWATWCPHCKAEMPAMQMVYDAYKNKGLTVLAVEVGENASLGGSYRDAHALTFPILNDAGRDVASTYQVTAFPSHFFVDPSGVISSVTIGGLDYWALTNKVKGMLNLP
jgi:peroxiredoxin